MHSWDNNAERYRLHLPPQVASDGASKPLKPLHHPLATGALEQDPWGWRYSSARGAWRMHTGLETAAVVPGDAVVGDTVGWLVGS